MNANDFGANIVRKKNKKVNMGRDRNNAEQTRKCF